jgi:hypothetical protein
MIMNLSNKINSFIGSHSTDIFLAILFISTVGCILQISGTSWDVTSHLLNRPETFFTPSHTLLYSGVGLLVISAAISLYLLLNNKQIRANSYITAFKLLIIGSILSLVAGPSDYLWHQTFGIDGLLSPTHLTLITGMLINSIGVVLGLSRIIIHLPTARQQKLSSAALIPAFAAMWLTIIWFVYMFSLPLSKGPHFNFNLNPVFESIIAVILLPLLGSMVFVTTSRTFRKFGAASGVMAIVIGINSMTNIIPSNQFISFLPWYLMLMIPAVISDLVLNNISITKKIDIQRSVIIAGALIGSSFYIFGYPMLPMTFAEPISYTFHSIGDILVNFIRTLPLVFAITLAPAVAMGIAGAVLSTKKIETPQINISGSEDMNKNKVAEIR